MNDPAGGGAAIDRGQPIPARARSRRRRWALGLALLAASPLLGCRSVARAVLFKANDRPVPAEGVGNWKVVDYRTEGGHSLRGALLRDEPTEGSSRPLLVWFHGRGDCVRNNMARAEIVHAAGFDVFLAEYRGFGGCPGEPSEAALIADGRAGLTAAEQATGVPASEAILVGISLGSGVVSALAAEQRGRAVILISAFTSIRDLADDYAPRPLVQVVVPPLFESMPRLAQSQHQVLVIHGTADPGIEFAHGVRIAEALGPRAHLVGLEGAGHDCHFEPRHWERVGQEARAFAENLAPAR